RSQLQSRRFIVAAGLPLAELGIENGTLVAIRVAEVQSRPCGDVQLVVGTLVAEHVAAVVSEPQRARVRMEGHPNAITNSARKHFEACSIRLHPKHAVKRLRPLADVARGADGEGE